MHSFEERAAMRYGVVPAVILQNIFYWCEKNKANGTHYHDGHYWTYNSEKAFSLLFGYLTKWQIRTALKKLKDEGAILSGNYNASAYDRTLWYTVTDEAIRLLKPDYVNSNEATPKLQNCNLGVGEEQNQNCRDATPIPDSKPDINKTDSNPDINREGGKAPAHPRKPPKETYGEYQNVRLTEDERNKLFDEYGEADTLAGIKILDEYIEETGKKYKSHYLVMKRWVFDAVKDRKAKQTPPNGGRLASGGYDWENL